jgi:hypothetical protein
MSPRTSSQDLVPFGEDPDPRRQRRKRRSEQAQAWRDLGCAVVMIAGGVLVLAWAVLWVRLLVK